MTKNSKYSVDNIVTDEINEDVEIQVNELKEEICKVLWVDIYGFGFDFKGYGIHIKTDKEFDNSHINEYITVQYEGDIGESNFKYHVKYE